MINDGLIRKTNLEQTYLSGSLHSKKIYALIIFIISIAAFGISLFDIFQLNLFKNGKMKFNAMIGFKEGIFLVIGLFIKDMYIQTFSNSNKVKRHWIWILIYTIIIGAYLAIQLLIKDNTAKFLIPDNGPKGLIISGIYLFMFRYLITFIYDLNLFISEKYTKPFLHRALKWKAVLYLWLVFIFLMFLSWWHTKQIPFSFVSKWFYGRSIYWFVFIGFVLFSFVSITILLPFTKWIVEKASDKGSPQTKYMVAKSISLVCSAMLSVIFLINNKDYRLKVHDLIIIGLLVINFIIYLLFLFLSKNESRSPVVKMIHLSSFLFVGIICLAIASDGLLWYYNNTLVLFIYITLSITAIIIWQIKEPIVTNKIMRIMSLITSAIMGTLSELIILGGLHINRLTPEFSVFQLNIYIFAGLSGLILLINCIKLWIISKKINKERKTIAKLRKGEYEK